MSWLSELSKNITIRFGKGVVKNTGEVVIKDGGKLIAKEGIEDLAKATIKDSVDNIARDGAKNAFKDGGKEAVELAVKNTAIDTSKSASKKIIIAGVVIVSLSAATAAAAILADMKNNADFTITSITDSSGIFGFLTTSKPCRVKYFPAAEILPKDKVVLSETNSSPNVDGEYQVSKIISDTEIEIELSNMITTSGSSGKLKIKTSVGNIISAGIEDTGKGIGSILGTTANSVFKPITSGVLGGLGIDPNIALIGIGIIVLLFMYKFFRSIR